MILLHRLVFLLRGEDEIDLDKDLSAAWRPCSAGFVCRYADWARETNPLIFKSVLGQLVHYHPFSYLGNLCFPHLLCFGSLFIQILSLLLCDSLTTNQVVISVASLIL